MVSVQILGIIILASASIFMSNAFAATLDVEYTIGDMKSIDGSKYYAEVLSIQRNSNGEVISAIQTNALRYLEHPMLDKYLDIVPNVKTGTVNGKIVELKQMDWTTEFPDCFEKVTCQNYMHSFVTILGMSYQGESYEVFRGLNHAHVVQMGDSVTSYWSVYRTLD